MEGVRVFSPDDWDASGKEATTFAAEDLKNCLEGLARHLFGNISLRTFIAQSMKTCYHSIMNNFYLESPS